jgi:hypothetical protein
VQHVVKGWVVTKVNPYHQVQFVVPNKMQEGNNMCGRWVAEGSLYEHLAGVEVTGVTKADFCHNLYASNAAGAQRGSKDGAGSARKGSPNLTSATTTCKV